MRGERSILVMIVVAFLVISILVQSSGGGFGFSCDLEISPAEEMDVSVNYLIGESRISKTVNVVTYSTTLVREDHVYIFNDYPGVNGSYFPRVSGLYDHMNAKFQLYGYSGDVSLIDREELDEVLQGPNATLIIASQPSNDTSISQAMFDWVFSGGVVIGIGNKSVPFIQDPGDGIVGGGNISLRFDGLSFMDGEGMHVSPTAGAFDFEVVAPTKGIYVQDVQTQGGSVVGYTYQRGELLTSAALFEIGEGRLLMMSGDMVFPIITSGEEAYANDICKMLAGSALWMDGDPYFDSVSAGSEEVSGTLSAELPPSPYLMVLAFDTDEFQDVFHSMVFPVDQSNFFVVPTTSHTYGSPLSRAT